MPGARKTSDLKMPLKNDMTQDKRYNYPQFVNKSGKRDMRTTPTSKR
jgi:hypothetical protein